MSIAIVWGSSTGYTEEVAKAIAAQLSQHGPVLYDVASTPLSRVHAHEVILVGCPTWNVGELQEDWSDRVREISALDWSGKKVGFFGCGDSHGYPDTCQDAMGMLWAHFAGAGATLVGAWSTTGYEFEDSRALTQDRRSFVGLAIDQENQAALTPERIRGWTHQLRSELGLG